MGQFHFLEAQLGLPHQLVIVRIALPTGRFPRETDACWPKPSRGSLLYGRRPTPDRAAQPLPKTRLPKGPVSLDRPARTRQRICGRQIETTPARSRASVHGGGRRPSPRGCTRVFALPINHDVLPLGRISDDPLGLPGDAASCGSLLALYLHIGC